MEKRKTSLMSIIAHDLNNALTAVSGGIQLIKMEGEENLTEGQRKYEAIVLLAADDAKRIISNLSNIDEMEQGALKMERAHFNLDHLVREEADKMKAVARYDRITISLQMDENMPRISADKELLRHVITNLINNAVRSTMPDSSVAVNISYKKEDNDFYVQVENAGREIPEEYLGRVFDKLVQVETDDEVKVNYGLSLTFCKMAAELHGGKIWAANNQGKGSVFTLTLPRGSTGDI